MPRRKKQTTLFELAPPAKTSPRQIAVKYSALRLMPNDKPIDHLHARSLAGLIHRWGVTTPLIVEPEGKHYVVNAGRHRHAAVGILRAGGLMWNNGADTVELEPQVRRFETVPCMLISALPGGEVSQAAITLLENHARVGPTCWLNLTR